MKTALFLGAGASVFASMPDTKELMKKVKEYVQKDTDKSTYQYFTAIMDDTIYSDVEKLYDGIEYTININNHTNCLPIIKRMQDPEYGINYDDIIVNLKDLKDIIRKVLIDSFVIKSEIHPKIVQMYNMIWEVMKNSGTDTFQIFTTNYDDVIDRYGNKTMREIVNGFEGNEYERLTEHWCNKWTASKDNPLYLTKLHGSVKWYKNDDGDIVEIGGIEERDVNKDVLIVPTEGGKDKSYNDEPFFSLMERFKTEIEKIDVLLVIGFSYRDKKITDIIKNSVENKGMFLISISPTAVKDIQQISKSKPKIKEINGQQIQIVDGRIFLCTQEFKPDTANNIRDELSTYYTLIQNHTAQMG